MLAATQQLLLYFSSPPTERNLAVIDAYVQAIVCYGTLTDAMALLPLYTAHSNHYHYTALLPVFKQHGNATLSEQLFAAAIDNKQLKDDVDPSILEVLGCLKHPNIQPILAHYIFDNQPTLYYVSKYAVLGFLNFDAQEYQESILKAIEACYGKSLFPEFVPALVSLLNKPSEVLEKLYTLGNEYASTDCNAGIILGFARCGELGRAYFKRVLFDAQWEANSEGTGTLHYAYLGLMHLNITFESLYYEIISMPTTHRSYALSTFLNLLKHHIQWSARGSWLQLYQHLFSWKNENERNNLIDWSEEHHLENDAYEIQTLLVMAIKNEIIVNERSLFF